jgi:hypothetical protein
LNFGLSFFIHSPFQSVLKRDFYSLHQAMPLVTLTSDIGEQDYLVGAAKGRLLRINPDFSIVDITHKLSPFNYPQASMYVVMP